MTKHDSWQDKLNHSIDKTKNDPSSRFFQLATVDKFGCPHNRTVVMRHFHSEKGLIEIVSDRRSEKFEQLKFNSSVAICWYFSETREQYRMQCRTTLTCATADKSKLAREWSLLSHDLQVQFFGPPPGSPLSSYGEWRNQDRANPPANFAIVNFFIETVDYLNVAESPHLRMKFFSDPQARWQTEQITP
ncbi:pyridoxamine 5'-phosphate oxidase family protein [Alteromonas sp. ASW11-130]|uniref:pyridoxamine 5'-phosphate oxidase family protein n=1 Tax=Alteromonas sp. ASW11-130 TaxID=3015775 RepID=UPI002242C608|nr:pyridoxamine 5'-phosphate oxidase family protein [Alteromonas sp. ASW11-130]